MHTKPTATHFSLLAASLENIPARLLALDAALDAAGRCAAAAGASEVAEAGFEAHLCRERGGRWSELERRVEKNLTAKIPRALLGRVRAGERRDGMKIA